VASEYPKEPGNAEEADAEVNLLLVSIRNDHYFVVERQPGPPSRTLDTYTIPIAAVDAVHMERVSPAAPASESIVILVVSTTLSP
jgi:hypothetical protein